MELRTDLAMERRELVEEDIKGADYSKREESGLVVERLEIRTERAGQILKKPRGVYITIELEPLTDRVETGDRRIGVISREIEKLLPAYGPVLVAGLGNMEITPDALGPKTSSGILATRHINGEIARSTGLDHLRSVAVLSTGVTGQTGIETSEYLLGVIKLIKPSALIVIDALASRRLCRLGKTLQISDAGISPGAGVGNHRARIDRSTMGIPVISIGVPTVVDAITLACDLLQSDDDSELQQIFSEVSPQGRSMVVTPKEIDLLVSRAARLISLCINCALQKDMEPEDLFALL